MKAVLKFGRRGGGSWGSDPAPSPDYYLLYLRALARVVGAK